LESIPDISQGNLTMPLPNFGIFNSVPASVSQNIFINLNKQLAE